jgi:hypothetical protein
MDARRRVVLLVVAVVGSACPGVSSSREPGTPRRELPPDVRAAPASEELRWDRLLLEAIEQGSGAQAMMALLQVLVTGQISQFRGLPSGVPIAALRGLWPVSACYQGAGFLGERSRSMDYLSVPLPEGRGARLWFVDGIIVLVDVAHNEVSWDALRGLGEPAARIDPEWRGTPVPAGELVFPDRGLAVHTRPTAQRSFHIVAFSPTDLERYQADLRLRFSLRFLPDELGAR